MNAAKEQPGVEPSFVQPLWRPSEERVKATRLADFIRFVEAKSNRKFPDYASLHRWSIANPEEFWTAVWEHTRIIAAARGARIIETKDAMPGARFFPDAKLNYARNLLRRHDGEPAILFRNESGLRRQLSWRELQDEVSRLQQALKAEGVGAGDRVAAVLPNIPETVIAMLAATSLGAVWSSCSPDFGVQGVYERFGQIEPKVLFCVDGYPYNGKSHDALAKAKEIAAKLPTAAKIVLVPYAQANPNPRSVDARAVLLADFIAPYRAGEVEYRDLPFNHPLYILFSSGTTGMPKCIVHGAGGTLIKHLQEHQHNCDIRAGDRVFFFTTTGWMMWNWLASCLASEATILLYDGAPSYPSMNTIFDLIDSEKLTHLGTSAKFIDALAKAKLRPMASHSLASLRTILSTGSPLAPAGFDYIYREVKADVCLSSVSGGTDIIGCFVGGNPMGPVWRGEIQALALGLDVQVFDDAGQPLPPGTQGELVCANSFPSMPLGFWNDEGERKYREAYFQHFPGVWRHGDWVELTEHGGVIIYGRSDAVLNPGGVRIGTAEIYRQVEKLDEVQEALAIGQQWQNDVRVVLFVRLKEGVRLDDALIAKIKKQIRDSTTPRHVPAKVIQVADIPRTVNNKIVELAVRDVVHGRPVKNKEALANPEALKLYENLPELRT
jgi:acetoacetyl-CoA synthetase